MIDLIDAHRTIRREFIELANHWNGARGQWRDETAIQFEKEYWQPSERVIDDYLRGLNQLIGVLERAEREVYGK